MKMRELVTFLPCTTLVLLVACSMERPTQAEDTAPLFVTQTAPLTAAEVGSDLASKGLVTPAEALNLAQLGTDIAYDIFVTPAAPSATDHIVFVALAWQGAAVPKSGLVRWSKDNWATQKDVAGKPTLLLGRQGILFDLGVFTPGTQLHTTFKLVTPTGEVWLNNGTKDWIATVQTPAPLQGVGALEVRQDGWKRNIPADMVWTNHPLSVAVETWPEVPGVKVTLHWKVGAGPVIATPMAIDAIHYGGYGMNTRWLGAIPAAQLMPGSNLTFWVEAASPKNTLWDSKNGKNYIGSIGLPPKMSWGQTGHTAFSKGWALPDGTYKTGYAFQAGLDSPFASMPSSYWPPTKPAVELYIAGLTDLDSATEAGKAGFVQVEVVSPFFSGKPSGDWRSYTLDFFEKSGNNWRFDWNVRQHGSPLSSPNGVNWVDDGNYAYKFRISIDRGATWSWLGTAPWPAGGDNLMLTWQNLVFAPQLTVSGSATLPTIKSGKSAVQKVELVNTSNDTFTVKGCAINPTVGPLTMTLKGCPAAGKTTTLGPGKRITVTLTFKPKKVGSYAANLKLDMFATSNLSIKGIFAVPFSAIAN